MYTSNINTFNDNSAHISSVHGQSKVHLIAYLHGRNELNLDRHRTGAPSIYMSIYVMYCWLESI